MLYVNCMESARARVESVWVRVLACRRFACNCREESFFVLHTTDRLGL